MVFAIYWRESAMDLHVFPLGSSFTHLIRTDFKWILFNGWVIFHCVYVPQLSYPFVCWWASRLLPCPGYYKQCCDEHWGTRVSFRSGFLGVYAQEWDCWVIWQFYFQFFFFFLGISTLFSIMAVLVCIPTNSVRGFPFLHTLSSIYCL